MKAIPRRLRAALLLIIIIWAVVCQSQQYDDYPPPQDDYPQDNLYADYAARQEQKQVGGGGGGGGPAWGSILLGGTVGWLAGGKFHSGRLAKKLNAKHKEEQKALYKQYYSDVYTLQQQNAELVQALESYGVKIR